MLFEIFISIIKYFSCSIGWPPTILSSLKTVIRSCFVLMFHYITITSLVFICYLNCLRIDLFTLDMTRSVIFLIRFTASRQKKKNKIYYLSWLMLSIFNIAFTKLLEYGFYHVFTDERLPPQNMTFVIRHSIQ